MAEHPGLRQSLPPVVIGLVLLACTVAGLAAGVGARYLVDGLTLGDVSSGLHGQQSISATRTAVPQPTTMPTPDLSETATAGAEFTGFTLSVSVSPEVVTAGKQFRVTATVVSAGGAGLAGVPCTLGPVSGGASLFTQWPPAKLSDAKGEVSWTLTAPPGASAGMYPLQVQGTGSLDYYYHVDVTVEVSG